MPTPCMMSSRQPPTTRPPRHWQCQSSSPQPVHFYGLETDMMAMHLDENCTCRLTLCWCVPLPHLLPDVRPPAVGRDLLLRPPQRRRLIATFGLNCALSRRLNREHFVSGSITDQLTNASHRGFANSRANASLPSNSLFSWASPNTSQPHI